MSRRFLIIVYAIGIIIFIVLGKGIYDKVDSKFNKTSTSISSSAEDIDDDMFGIKGLSDFTTEVPAIIKNSKEWKSFKRSKYYDKYCEFEFINDFTTVTGYCNNGDFLIKVYCETSGPKVSVTVYDGFSDDVVASFN